MPRLLWDQVGSRVFETGVDHGVLYLQDGTGVPWNGLISVDETSNNVTQNPFYLDENKVFSKRSTGEFSAVLKAYTYPDEFLQFEGFLSPATGMYVDEQPVYSRFGLSYRTKIANDTQDSSHGYKLHILYNLSATPVANTFDTNGVDVETSEFGWDISGIPEVFARFSPTVHVIIDSRKIPPASMELLENSLYGTPTTTATLPPMNELFGITFSVVDNGDGTWTATGHADVIEYWAPDTFIIDWATAVYIDEFTYTLS